MSNDPYVGNLHAGLSRKPPVGNEQNPVHRSVRNIMLFTDPPRHTTRRRICNRHFSKKIVEQLRATVERSIDELWGSLPVGCEFDVVSRGIEPLTTRVICEICDIPTKDWPMLRDWSQQLSPMVEGIKSRKDWQIAETAATEFAQYLDRRLYKHEPSSLVAALAALADAEGATSEHERFANLMFIFAAGHGTTASLLATMLLWCLQDPSLRRTLVDDPASRTAAIEEVLRLESPVQLTMRTARTDRDLDGHSIKAGDRILLLLGAANRDASRFTEPDSFELSRPLFEHVTFGGGVHFCLGGTLARLQARAFLDCTLERISDMTIVHVPVWRKSLVFRSIEQMSVRIR